MAAFAALLKTAGSKAAMQGGKKLAANLSKEALKAKAKDFVIDKAKDKIKSKFNKKKLKGKDIANKMLGGGDGGSSGGPLVVRPSSSIVSSPAGGLVPSSKVDEGGSLVVGNDSKELGLTPFMESVIGVKESVESIKESLNDNSKDAQKRLEKQRLLNAKFRKEEREEQLETKKPGLGIGKKIMKPAKDAAGNFLSKILRFLKATLLGMFVNALAGGARDVVVAFLFGFKAYTMAKDAAVKFILGLKGNIGKGISTAGKGITKVGSAIGNFLGKVRGVLVGWIKNAIDVVKNSWKGIKNIGKSAGKAVGRGFQALRKTKLGKGIEKGVKSLVKKPLQTLNKGARAAQNFIRNPGKSLKSGLKTLQKSKIGKGVSSFIKSPGKTLQRGLKTLQKTQAGKFATNLIKRPGKTLQGGIKALQKTQAGKTLQGGLKTLQKTQAGKFATNLIKNPGKTLQGGLKTLQKTQAGKFATNLIKNPGKTLQGGLKSLQKSKVGKGAANMLGGIKNWGARKWKGAVELGGKAWKGISKWADNMAKNAMKWTDDVVKGGLEQAKKWRKQLGDILELVKNPMKLVEKVKGMLSGKMDKMVKNNKIIKQVMELKKNPKKIGQLLKQVGKNKNVVKTTKILKKGAKLKIAGLDAVLAALMGVIDYAAFGESPINAVLRAAGALIGYTAGFAIGAPFGGVPGFITGMAGSFVGEKAADVIAAGLAQTPLGSKPDPIMGDGRMLVRNPFSGKGEGERMDSIQEKQAQLGDNKKEDISKDIDKKASYEEEGVDETVIIDGGQTAAAPASQAGKVKFIPLGLSKETIVNSQYEKDFNAALYKV